MTTDTLYNSKQSINIIEVDLKHSEVSFDLAHADSTLIPTSVFAQNHQAFAAINGSFFDMRKGGSVVFMQEGGKVKTNEPQKGYVDNAALCIDENGALYIKERPCNGWALMEDVVDVLASGPYLIENHRIQLFKVDKFNRNRHPRSAIGLTLDQKVLLITVDGRSSQAHGMSIPELAAYLHGLGCYVAINLDGGGSTTLWVKNEFSNGVVNYPSDNRKYDHDGERPVANCILLKEASDK